VTEGWYSITLDSSSPLTPGDTFTGKLKNKCPLLFSSLSALEKDLLDSAFGGVEDCRPSSPVNPLSDGRGGLLPNSTNLGGKMGLNQVVDTSLPQSPLANTFPSGAFATSGVPGRVSSHVLGHPYSDRTCFNMDKASSTILDLNPPTLSGFREPEPKENSRGDLLEYLVPTFKEIHQPVPIPTFQGRIVVVSDSTRHYVGQPQWSREVSLKDYAWTRGLGLELSPIKTRSAIKKSNYYSWDTRSTYY